MSRLILKKNTQVFLKLEKTGKINVKPLINMRQVIQNYKTGIISVEEVPNPAVLPNNLLIKTACSLISVGTERSKIETAQMNLLEKAIMRIDLVKQLFNNVKQEGIFLTFRKAMNKLNSPVSLGYSCSGEVIEKGSAVKGFNVGDKVACVGESFAAHSEINSCPQENCVLLPKDVDFEEGAFSGLGAIALNAVQISQSREDEYVAVIGLGLIGQIVCQILKTKGCKVVGIEIDEGKIAFAKKFDIDICANPVKDDVSSIAHDFTQGKGIDAVIIAAASRNNLPIELAGKISRVKGRVILVGAMPIIIPRKDYYEKELTFMISRGFGSGLYFNEEFERWYPYNYRPISVKENIRNFLNLVSAKDIKIKPFITHRFSLLEAKKVYQLISSNKESYLGVLFTYNKILEQKVNKVPVLNSQRLLPLNIGFIGAGSFAQGYILPVLKKIKGVNLKGVATATGINSKYVAKKFCFEFCTTDYNVILNDKNINCVFIVTRHNLHAGLVIEALKKGKHIFVEKPLCLNENELKNIISVYNHKVQLMVGFNRRFSPFIAQAKEFFKNRGSVLMANYRINAGYIPQGHWLFDFREGGRILGEVCHFVDLLQYLTGEFPDEISAVHAGKDKDSSAIENVLITIKFSGGSVGSINYNAIGDISFPRERIEIFGENSVAVIDNFKEASFSRNGIVKKMKQCSRDMGHNDEIKSFTDLIAHGGKSLIPFKEIVASTLATFKIMESLSKNGPIRVNLKDFINE